MFVPLAHVLPVFIPFYRVFTRISAHTHTRLYTNKHISIFLWFDFLNTLANDCSSVVTFIQYSAIYPSILLLLLLRRDMKTFRWAFECYRYIWSRVNCAVALHNIAISVMAQPYFHTHTQRYFRNIKSDHTIVALAVQYKHWRHLLRQITEGISIHFSLSTSRWSCAYAICHFVDWRINKTNRAVCVHCSYVGCVVYSCNVSVLFFFSSSIFPYFFSFHLKKGK